MRSRLFPAAGGVAAGLALALTVLTTQSAAAAGPAWQDVSPEDGAGTVLTKVESAGATTWAVGKVLRDGKNPEVPLAMRWNGRSWERSALPTDRGALADLSVSAPGQVWAAGTAVESTAEGNESARALLLRRAGSAWRTVSLPVPATATDSGLSALDTTADGQIWAFGWYSDEQGGGNVLFHRDAAGTWSTLPADTGLNWVDGFEAEPDGTLVATGDGVSRFDGHTWVEQALPGENTILAGVEVRSARDIWAVGFHPDEELWRRPAVLHFDGHTWRELPVPAETGQLYDVAFDGSGRPVIVGETQDAAVDEDGNYVLTRGRNGAFARTESPSGAGFLYGAATDRTGKVWVVGGAAGAVDAVSPGAYAGLRG
ncbi:hypothetical protein AB0D35_15650 [Streptomyces sp. NPDC048301]|uniref:hypothetical protein n=1 Tax=unclassified Streptomyces TaxID=2593676 RepID=UPI003415E2FF